MAAVNGELHGDNGVAHAAELVTFTEAVMGEDARALARSRSALRVVLTDAAFVDTCAVIAAFNVVDRVADSTGIPLDDFMAAMSTDVRAELGLSRFRSSANTRGG